MASTAALYTPEVLALAVSLAEHPLDPAAWQGEARSASCGSTLRLGLELDAAGAILRVSMAAQACAVGQAAAAIFAGAAPGRSRHDVAQAQAAIAAWLDASARGEAAVLPAWPGLAAIAGAAAFPARHGAILLAWRAAEAAFAARNETAT